MPNSIPLGFAALGYAALTAYARGSSAVSIEAQASEAAANEVVESVERSHALFGDRAATISSLHQIAFECQSPGWDGSDAKPIETMAVFRTEVLIRAIPSSLPMPELAPEPDGQIALDWIQSKNRIFSLSIGKSGRLSYSWLDGADQGYAVARFDYCSLPPRILEGIVSIIGNASFGLT